jgi:hypothetical protein
MADHAADVRRAAVRTGALLRSDRVAGNNVAAGIRCSFSHRRLRDFDVRYELNTCPRPALTGLECGANYWALAIRGAPWMLRQLTGLRQNSRTESVR